MKEQSKPKYLKPSKRMLETAKRLYTDRKGKSFTPLEMRVTGHQFTLHKI